MAAGEVPGQAGGAVLRPGQDTFSISAASVYQIFQFSERAMSSPWLRRSGI